MKSNFFGELKDKFMKATDVPEDSAEFDIEDDDYDYNEEPAQTAGSFSSDFDSNSDYSYKFGGNDFSSNSSSFGYEEKKSRTEPARESSKFTKKQGTNIYQMNNSGAAAAVKVNRVVYFYLEDRDDARNIADCMAAQDAVVLLDMSKLDREDSMCVLHFLDGVKYVYKSKMETIATNVYLIVPSTIELAGDFYEQVSPGIFY